MSRKRDPIVTVLEFFNTATLEAAQMALALVKAAVRARTPLPEKKRRLAKRPVSEVTPRVSAAAPPAAQPSTGTPGHRMPRRRMHAAPSQREQDVALPGLGPATVGE